jgi:hypothetical protein
LMNESMVCLHMSPMWSTACWRVSPSFSMKTQIMLCILPRACLMLYENRSWCVLYLVQGVWQVARRWRSH